MKKAITLISFIGLISASIASAQPAYSNVVGMISFTVTKGDYSLIHAPFENDSAPVPTVTDVFGTTLPNGSQVLAWDEATQQYVSSSYITGIGWLPNTLEVDRGTGFFLLVPDDGGTSTLDVIVSGGVPDEASRQINVVDGFQFLGFPYPTARDLSEMELTTSASNGDIIYIWTASGWQSSSYITGLGWLPDRTIEPGQSFMYRSNATRSYDEPQPYSLD